MRGFGYMIIYRLGEKRHERVWVLGEKRQERVWVHDNLSSWREEA
jgi:hypothetical protein